MTDRLYQAGSAKVVAEIKPADAKKAEEVEKWIEKTNTKLADAIQAAVGK